MSGLADRVKYNIFDMLGFETHLKHHSFEMPGLSYHAKYNNFGMPSFEKFEDHLKSYNICSTFQA